MVRSLLVKGRLVLLLFWLRYRYGKRLGHLLATHWIRGGRDGAWLAFLVAPRDGGLQAMSSRLYYQQSLSLCGTGGRSCVPARHAWNFYPLR